MVKAQPLFEAYSTPLDSLGPRGFRILAWLVCGAFAGLGVLFTLMGAWPVLIFAGAEALLVLALVAVYRRRAARSAEWITLEDGRLTVRRREGMRQEAASFDPFWARLHWDGRRLLLAHRARRIEIGRFLAEEEKQELEAALDRALRAYREPRFENPQLRT